MSEEFAAEGDLEKHVDLIHAIEGRLQLEDERVTALVQHVLLVDHVLDLLEFDQLALLQAFEREGGLCALLLVIDQPHL